MLDAMRTTLTLDEDVAIRLEKLQQERGESFKRVVNDVLRRGFEALENPTTQRKRYRIKAHRSGRCHLPSLDSVHDALVFGEGEAYR
jgi:hypothetical protein